MTAVARLPDAQHDLAARVEQLERELAYAQQRFEAVRDIGTAIGSSLQLDRVLSVIVQRITDAMNAERSTLFLLDETQGELWAKVSLGSGPNEEEIRLAVGEGIAGWVAKTGQRINLKDAYKDARFSSTTDRRTGFRTTSLLCQPIRNHRRKIIGVVQVLNKREGYFTIDDETLLAALAGHAAISLESSQLYVELTHHNIELTDARDQLQKRVAEIDLLYRVEQEMNRSIGLESFLGSLLRHAAEAIPSEVGAIAILQGGSVRHFVRQAGDDRPLLEAPWGGTSGVLADSIASGVASALNDPAGFPTEPSITATTGTLLRNAVVVPLELDSERLGAVMLGNRSGISRPNYTTEDIKLLTLLAGRAEAAIVLDQRRREGLKADRLSAIGQALSGVLHDLKTPMTVIGGYSQIMAGCEDLTERKRLADGVRRQLGVLKSMAQEILAFARGESSLLLRRILLNEFVKEIDEALRADFDNGPELVIEGGYLGTCRMDSQKVTRALVNLARNAKEALRGSKGAGGGRGRVTIRTALDEAKDQVIFEVCDDGPGIPEAIRGRLFDAFVTSGKQNGTGLGLAIVKNIAEQHDGTITYETGTGIGTTFRLALPRGGPTVATADEAVTARSVAFATQAAGSRGGASP